jgi:hypothetical protein
MRRGRRNAHGGETPPLQETAQSGDGAGSAMAKNFSPHVVTRVPSAHDSFGDGDAVHVSGGHHEIPTPARWCAFLPAKPDRTARPLTFAVDRPGLLTNNERDGYHRRFPVRRPAALA